MKSEVFPVGLLLGGKLCVVVGSGDDSARRAEALVGAGAQVRVVSEHPAAGVERLAASSAVTLERRAFVDGDLDGAWLAVYTDMDAAVATRLAAAAEARHVFFCAVDIPAASSYAHLAIARAGALVLAISTNGKAPSLARRLRDELSRVFDESRLATFVEALASLRDRTARADRRAVLGAFVDEIRFDGRLMLPHPDDGDGPSGRD